MRRFHFMRAASPIPTDVTTAYELQFSTDGESFSSFTPPLSGAGPSGEGGAQPPIAIPDHLIELPNDLAPTTMLALKLKQTAAGANWWSITELTVHDCSTEK